MKDDRKKIIENAGAGEISCTEQNNSIKHPILINKIIYSSPMVACESMIYMNNNASFHTSL